MIMQKILFPLLALAGWLTIPCAQASWAYVPLEIRMAGAKYIVVGKVDRIVDGIERHNRTYDVGAIKVSKVLKGPNNLKEVKLMWPGPAPFALSTDIKFRKGQEGIWILYPDKEVKDVHWASYPSDFQPLKNRAQLESKLKTLVALPWSKAQNGLQVTAIAEATPMRKVTQLVNGKRVEGMASRATAHVVLRNQGGKSMQVLNFPGAKPFAYQLTGPDGKVIRVNQPPARGGKILKHHFQKLAPGEVKSMGYGLGLPSLSVRGKYTLTVTYANSRKELSADKQPVWIGKMTSKVEFEVK